MEHSDHVSLLEPADLPEGGIWADIGAGSGAFTLALRELVGPGAEIYAVDPDPSSLKELEQAYRDRFGSAVNLHAVPADLSAASSLPALDGVVMANSLHFFPDKKPVLQAVRGLLKPGGRLLLVEYNTDEGNLWVPFPLSFTTFHALAPQAGFSEPRMLATVPSSSLKEFYSAECLRVQPQAS
jgi:ubiquinone/menaquinone biosynthesis C-methylase UbiE